MGSREWKCEAGQLVAVSSGDSSDQRVQVRYHVREFKGKTAADRVDLVFDFNRESGLALTLSFASPRMDWGVHGRAPVGIGRPDHSFHEGFPPFLGRQFSESERLKSIQVFQQYTTTLVGEKPIQPVKQ